MIEEIKETLKRPTLPTELKAGYRQVLMAANYEKHITWLLKENARLKGELKRLNQGKENEIENRFKNS